MPEELKPAQTTEVQGAKPEDVGDGKVADPVNEKPKQSEEENREQARRRRLEDEKKALDKRELDTAIRLTGGKNPYTQEKIEDQADLEELYLMEEIKASGGDPIADYAKRLKQKRKEEKEKNQSKAEKETMNEEQIKNDWQAFSTAHPGISLKDLQADANFLDYADGKIGTKSLSVIYDGYLKLTGKTVKKIEKPSPGSLGGEVADSAEFYSSEQLDKFTPAQLHAMSPKQFEKVLKSKDHWAKK